MKIFAKVFLFAGEYVILNQWLFAVGGIYRFAPVGELMSELTREEVNELIRPKKNPDKQFYLDLLDAGLQWDYEEKHLRAVMYLLKVCYINKLKIKIAANKEEIGQIKADENLSAENYRRIIQLNAEIRGWREETESYKSFFTEPYFARMDLVDPI